MVPALLVGSALLAAGPGQQTLAPPDLAAYESARADVGRDPAAHVRLALWCEAHGLQAERIKHLAIAVLTDPANATARGLMGLVAYHGRWRRPDAVGETVKADAALGAVMAEYNTRRDRAPRTAEAQWRLALWCEENGLKPEAQAHLASVVRLDPSREAAWKRLGCKKHHGRWMTDAQAAAEKAEVEAQKQADKTWRPLLAKWAGGLGSKSKRAEAEEALARVTDRRAVPSVCAVFASGDARHQGLAVQLLGQIDAPASSRALAGLAISGRSPEVRRKATETLKRRDPREFAGFLIALLRDPITYEVRPVGGPGSPGALFVKGERFNVQRLYAPPSMPWIPVFPGDSIGYDSYGYLVLHHFTTQTLQSGRITGQQLLQAMQGPSSALPTLVGGSVEAADQIQFQPDVLSNALTSGGARQQVTQAIENVEKTQHFRPDQFGFGLRFNVTADRQIPIGAMMQEARKSAVVAEAQLERDVATVNAYNNAVNDDNDQVAAVLDQTTGQSLGKDRKAWEGWWTNQLGYAYRTPEEAPVPTVIENVPLAYVPQPVPVVTTLSSPTFAGVTRMSCFGAGTMVRTLAGPRAIESLKVGDQVLTQELNRGGLGYQPILVVHHNPPSPTFLIKLGGETIVSSPFHRFWKAGQGWVMARDLEAGDTLRMLDGLGRVDSVEAGPVQPVFNLDVAEDHDFFAGARGALVHDNTLPDLRQTPFDREPTLSALHGETKQP